MQSIKLEPSSQAGGRFCPKKPVAHVVPDEDQKSCYLWIGDDAAGGGCFATLEGNSLHALALEILKYRPRKPSQSKAAV